MIKTLLKSLREYKKSTLMTPLLVAGEALLEILMPTLMAYLIDYGINARDMGYVLRMGTVLVLVNVGAVLTSSR